MIKSAGKRKALKFDGVDDYIDTGITDNSILTKNELNSLKSLLAYYESLNSEFYKDWVDDKEEKENFQDEINIINGLKKLLKGVDEK